MCARMFVWEIVGMQFEKSCYQLKTIFIGMNLKLIKEILDIYELSNTVNTSFLMDCVM